MHSPHHEIYDRVQAVSVVLCFLFGWNIGKYSLGALVRDGLCAAIS